MKCILKDILMKVSASTLSYRYVKRKKIYHGFCCTYNEGEDLFVRVRQRVIIIWDFKLAVVLTVMTSSSRRKHGTLPAGRSYLPGIVAITIIHLVLVWGNSTHGYSCFCAFVRDWTPFLLFVQPNPCFREWGSKRYKEENSAIMERKDRGGERTRNFRAEKIH